MTEQPIQVIAYAGERGEESPRAYLLGGKRIAVRKVLAQWLEEDSTSRLRRRCFRVKGGDFLIRTLCCDEATGVWRLLE